MYRNVCNTLTKIILWVQQAGDGETTFYSRIFQKTQYLHKLAAQTDSKSQIRTAIARTKSAQLVTDQLAMRPRDSSKSEDVQRQLSPLSNSQDFIPFLTGYDVT
ncbi:hypothetical protein AVEN_72647-1 [Araneus ventricosus]|uniref:Uncharacterized protein n=1 Tax=Araneus ventricosus TaxID=182803 RepID=A0A4Y2DD76_ARAVE|nr:hypothetical protein AVEN_72647-1 [Araneus ventricosus]